MREAFCGATAADFDGDALRGPGNRLNYSTALGRRAFIARHAALARRTAWR